MMHETFYKKTIFWIIHSNSSEKEFFFPNFFWGEGGGGVDMLHKCGIWEFRDLVWGIIHVFSWMDRGSVWPGLIWIFFLFFFLYFIFLLQCWNQKMKNNNSERTRKRKEKKRWLYIYIRLGRGHVVGPGWARTRLYGVPRTPYYKTRGDMWGGGWQKLNGKIVGLDTWQDVIGWQHNLD